MTPQCQENHDRSEPQNPGSGSAAAGSSAPDRITWHWRKLQPRETDMELLWLIVLPLTAALYLLMQALRPAFFQCKFKALTGIPCATCGGTRTALAVVRDFDILAAFLNNPLVFVGLSLVSLYLVYAAVVVIFRRPRLRVRIPRRRRMQAGVVLLVLLLVNWAYLISDGR
jgi:hypothetical protein